MERTQHKQEINMTEPLMSRNQLISHYPEEEKKISFTTCTTRGSRCMTIG
jgi:hypothetical protein